MSFNTGMAGKVYRGMLIVEKQMENMRFIIKII